jgi:flagellar basal body-associated protein FliL
MTPIEITLIVLASLVLVAVVVFFVIWLVRKNGVIDHPEDEETEEKPETKEDEKK